MFSIPPRREPDDIQGEEVHVPVNVIDRDGLNPIQAWAVVNDYTTLQALGFPHPDRHTDIAAEDGLFDIPMRSETVRQIHEADKGDGAPFPAGWSYTETPKSEDYNRGESAVWAHLPSGIWVGIAPIDLEGYFIPNAGWGPSH